MRLFRRGLPPIPEPPGTPVYERRTTDWSIRSGWDRVIQRVRLELPDHLHNCPPFPNGGQGLWTVIAKVHDVPIGIAWSFQSVGDTHVAQLEELAVVPPWRRRGVGQRLVVESAAWMAEKGYRRLASMPVTPEANRLLGRLGFSDEGFRTQFVDIDELLAD